MVRGLLFSLIVHAVAFGIILVGWPQRTSECEREIARLRADNPGLDDVDIMLRVPQCASFLDIAVEIVDVGLVADIAPVDVPDDTKPEDTERVPDPADMTVPELDDLTPEEDLAVNRERAEDEPDDAAIDDRADAKVAPDKDALKKPKKDPLVEKTRPRPKDDLEALLADAENVLKDKSTAQRRKTASDEPEPIQKPVLPDVQTPRPGAGERKGNTASLSAALRKQIEYCWRGIDDLPPEDQIDVVIKMSLSRDGMIAGDAELVTPRSRPMGRAGIPVDTALRAVRKCAPYKLPVEDYDLWKDIEVTIGPRD